MRSRQVAAVLLGAAALAAVVSWGESRDRPVGLMEDDGLDADSIGMDQNAMLADSPKKNAAFLKVFGSYLGKSASSLKSSPKSATQLSQQAGGKKASSGSRKGENSRLASEMQAELTAGSADDQMMTPHFVAALNAASRPQMLASTDGDDRKADIVNKEAMAALSMADKGARHHVLPAKLREKYLFSQDKTELGAANTETPNEAALEAQPASSAAGSTQALAAAPAAGGGMQGRAAAADNKLLASAPEGLSTKQLIRQAAMRQMAVLKAKATIAAASAAPAQQQRPAYTQQMYQPAYGSPMYQQPPAPQYAAWSPFPAQGTAPQPMLSGYGAQAPAWYPAGQQQPAGQGAAGVPYNDSPQRLSGYTAPQSRAPAYSSFSAPPSAQTQQLAVGAEAGAAPVVAAAPVLTPQQIGEEAAKKAAPDMFSPDSVAKGKGSLASKREQMLALRSQIMSDYKKNTMDADKQLLMGV